VFSNITHAGLWFKIPSEKEEVKFFGATRESTSELDPENIRVLVWNQYKGKEQRFRSEFSRLSKNRDVLLLQEALMDKDMTKLYASQRSFSTVFAASFVYRFSGKATGVANAANISATSYEAQRSEGREIVGNTPKMVLFTTYPLKNRSDELLAVNIHALNSVSWKTLAVQIIKALGVVKKHQGPVIFGGDFNTWSKAKMNYLMHAMKRAGLDEVKFKHEERKMKVFGRALDHVFTRGVSVTNAYVEKTDGADHQPLLLELHVR